MSHHKNNCFLVILVTEIVGKLTSVVAIGLLVHLSLYNPFEKQFGHMY